MRAQRIYLRTSPCLFPCRLLPEHYLWEVFDYSSAQKVVKCLEKCRMELPKRLDHFHQKYQEDRDQRNALRSVPQGTTPRVASSTHPDRIENLPSRQFGGYYGQRAFLAPLYRMQSNAQCANVRPISENRTPKSLTTFVRL